MVRPISTRIIIDAPPAFVREKFLDFKSIPQYHTTFLKSLSAPNLSPGTTMTNEIDTMKFTPKILENSERCFKWRGSLVGIFNGEHAFRFEDAEGSGEEMRNKTLFVQEEEFSGLLGWIIGEGWVAGWIGMRENTEKGFVRFNEDLKTWCESKR